MLDNYAIDWSRIDFEQDIWLDFSAMQQLIMEKPAPRFLPVFVRQPWPRPLTAVAESDCLHPAFAYLTLFDLANQCLLLYEAFVKRNCGLPVGIAAINQGGAQSDGAYTVAVGDMADKTTLEKTKNGIFLGFNDDSYLRVWNLIARFPPSPLEVHFCWSPDDKLETAIVGLQRPGWATNDLKKAQTLAQMRRASMGRPPGITDSPEKVREVVLKAYQVRESSPGTPFDAIAPQLHMSENTLLSRRKEFLRDLMPRVAQLQRDGHTTAEIAMELEMDKRLLSAMIVDANKLGIR